MRIAMCDDEPIILDELLAISVPVSLQRGWYPVILTAL